ncbi:imidazole glycerol phosphate synthase subunit HisF [Halovivax cerinus]|uniref:Imidazole glycerol phosphate synthase subunit HisF n=1 Tax=Halovivax cerinus TaxID=1487865 RepID=A0ABD5NS10_9EURY|nr:imidazole glycerol phosphate synthase subunit HisF [Halovivax cerinus]
MGLTKRIIPCIDVDLDEDGNAAVYTGVNFENLEYTGDPVEMAREYNEAGADEFVFLDITASADGRETMLDVVESVADEVFIPLTVGGGIRTVEDIGETLRAGADKVSITSGALEDPDLITDGARAFGSQCIVISIDARRRYDDEGTHYVEADGESCWFECTKRGGREGTGIDVVEWAEEAERRGAGELFVNSIDRDGTKDGYDLPLTSAVTDAVDTPVIASSGCGSPDDMYDVFVAADADAALAASIFHFDEYSIRETKRALAERDVPVRLTDSDGSTR